MSVEPTTRHGLRRGSFAAKRVFDVVVALSAIVALLPVMLLVALAVRLKLGSPILFGQMRPGLNGRPFKMLKFRTMLDAVDVDGRPLPDRERLTAFGSLLRSSSLDELPELWNVVRGDMSLVGPRPLLVEYLPLYSAKQARRHEVRPGVTGWAQINGRNAISWQEKFDLDVWYVDNRSFALDMKILLLTVKKVLRSEGITAEGSATYERFTGSVD
jgi:lipopolysaccharide/colanic/teichoic acid biosynthesis glycosyltransferase